MFIVSVDRVLHVVRNGGLSCAKRTLMRGNEGRRKEKGQEEGEGRIQKSTYDLVVVNRTMSGDKAPLSRSRP